MQRTASPSPLSRASAVAEANEFPFDAPVSAPVMPSTPKVTSFGPSISRQLSMFGVSEADMHKHQEEQAGFADKRESLVAALDGTTALVKGLAAFNQEKWTIHYPHQLGVAGSTDVKRTNSSPPSTPPRSALKGSRPDALRRSASLFVDDSTSTADDDEDSKRPAPQRSYSTAETPAKVPATVSNAAPPAHPLSILSLDLKLGHPTAPTASLPALLPSLSLATLSQLLSRRLTTSLGHITSLRSRVVDTSSRILVTGDLNAGKSTLVNALLRRDVMPSDQQPCTTVFCEVLDASSYNDGEEEIHAIRDVEKYDPTNSETYDVFPLDQVNEVQDTGDTYQILKAYVTDGRAPLDEEAPNPSFIKNGLVSISLIDAPGLNRDTLSTTALFARQSEIDVIVFVVSAENHFTLSAKEFLWNASREKAYVFIVVNKWNGIKDKARCMRVVGEQIKQLSPATWESRQELVHFVDAADALDEEDPSTSTAAAAIAEEEDTHAEPTAFDHLEQSLRSFVLLKRTKSKLAPAKHYLLNLLADLTTLADTNLIAANDELAEALRQLARVKPIHERLSAQRDEVEEGVDRVEETVVEVVRSAAWGRLERALGFVGRGQVVPSMEGDVVVATAAAGDGLVAPTELPEFPGVMGLWDWANDVKKTLVRALEVEVRQAEDDARRETVGGVDKVMNGLGNKYLPGTSGDNKKNDKDATATPERVFRPEVMFAKRRRGVGKLAARGISTGLGLGTSSAGLSHHSNGWTATDFDVSFFDLFDLERIYAHGHKIRGTKTIAEDDLVETSTILGLGLGSVGMLGSRLIGVKGTMQSISRMVEMLSSPTARKWAGPVIGVITVGLVAYIIVDLPRAIPRNIGRKLQLSLSSSTDLVPVSSNTTSTPPTTFSSAHSDRIARETRKVLRLAGWDLRERFRAALEQSAAERRQVEATVSKAEGALKFLGEFVEKVEDEERRVEEVVL